MDMFQDLLTSSSASRVAPETLEMIGRKASQMFQQQGVPLNEAIRQLAAQHPELGNEHIKRIVEFANNSTFQEMFEKSPDKNIHFQVADPGVVLRDLKDGGSPGHDGKTLQGGMGDYLMPPNMGKGHESSLDNELSNLFSQRPADNSGGDTQVKLAHPESHAQHANPVDDVYDTHTKLQAAKQELEGAHERFDLLVKQAGAELYNVVKREVLSPEGAGLGGIINVLEKVASRDLVLTALQPIIEKLAAERIPQSSLMISLEKRAGKVVNQNHPLLHAWAGLVKAAEEKAKTEVALGEVNAGLAETTRFLQKQSGAITSEVKKAVGIRGRVPAGLRQRFPRT